MSKPLQMVDCPSCSHVVRVDGTKVTISTGKIVRYYGKKGMLIEDTCDGCGGSGRISVKYQKMYDRRTILLKKKQKTDMREWISKEKELVYGVKD